LALCPIFALDNVREDGFLVSSTTVSSGKLLGQLQHPRVPDGDVYDSPMAGQTDMPYQLVDHRSGAGGFGIKSKVALLSAA